MDTGVDVLEVELQRALAAAPERLDLVALAIARLDDARVDDEQVLGQLDRWGAAVRAAVRAPRPSGLEALAVVLGGENGLRGDDAEYDEPANSFLPRVLERRRGLPIALSVVYLEVARRAGIPLFGLALPGHFVVAQEADPGALVVLDPFAGGQVMSHGELQTTLARVGASLRPAMLEPASAHTIACRMLRNLVGSYQRRARWDMVRAAAALLRAIEPGDPTARHAMDDAAPSDDDLN